MAALTQPRSKIALVLLAYIAFISLGLPDGLIGVAWPSIRDGFRLEQGALGALFISSMVGYLTSSFLSGRLMARLGVGRLLSLSCILTGAGLLGYTLVPEWWMIVVLGVVAGLGAGAIDAGLNTYIAANHGEGLMQWLHAFFGVGVTLGPIIMTAGLNIFETWRLGYVIVGVAQIALGVSFGLTAAMWKSSEDSAAEKQKMTDYKTPIAETLRQPGAWISFLLFFVYVGVELTLGHWAYTLLTEARGVAPDVAGLWAGSYWGSFTLGRLLAGWYTRHIGVRMLLLISMIGALIGALLVWWNPGETISIVGIVLIGFAIAPIFPGMVSETSLRVGVDHAANTIGMQISAAGLGVAVIPALAGTLAQRISLEIIPPYLVSLIVALLVLYTLSLRWQVKSAAAQPAEAVPAP
jgi:fucose permease